MPVAELGQLLFEVLLAVTPCISNLDRFKIKKSPLTWRGS
jgi:hypothetical protein